jgi:hypothetical protein
VSITDDWDLKVFHSSPMPHLRNNFRTRSHILVTFSNKYYLVLVNTYYFSTDLTTTQCAAAGL